MKKYTLTRLHSMVVSFKIPSGVKVVTFDGGSRHHERRGSFVTSDKELQEAMEKSVMFNRDYTLASVVEDKTETKEVVKEDAPTDYKALLKDAESVIEEPSVTTIQKAKMWLQANYGKSFKGTTKDDIKREAASLYNVLFPNWL